MQIKDLATKVELGAEMADVRGGARSFANIDLSNIGSVVEYKPENHVTQESGIGLDITQSFDGVTVSGKRNRVGNMKFRNLKSYNKSKIWNGDVNADTYINF